MTEPPVLIIGASRSGTGLFVRVLAASGYATGACTGNQECRAFQRLNRWLLFNAGAGLETPELFDVLLDDPTARRVATAIVRAHARSLPEGAVFKDPRTTFTLPIWRDVWPEGKVLHVQRHGVDAAASLVARRQRVEQKWAGTSHDFAAQVAAHLRLVEEQRVVANLRVRDMVTAFDHWRSYVTRARELVAALPVRDVMTVTYEDLLLQPDVTLWRLSNFLERPITAAGVALDASRAYAHRRSPVLTDFAIAHARYLDD